MNEELLNEHTLLQHTQDRQSGLIAEHCFHLEEHIRAAHSLAEAEQIADIACRQLESQCFSVIIRTILVQNIQEKIRRHWNVQKTIR